MLIYFPVLSLLYGALYVCILITQVIPDENKKIIVMKKLLFLAIAAFTFTAIVPTVFKANEAKAQIVRTITIAAADDTLTNTDTAHVTLSFDQSWKSVEAWVKEVSGTTGGKVYFQGEYLHGSEYNNLDSLILTDVTTAQYKLFTVPSPRLYKSFRLQYLHSGTGVMEIKGYYVRYTGGAILRANPDNGLAWLHKPTINTGYQTNYRFINNWKGDLILINDKRKATVVKTAA